MVFLKGYNFLFTPFTDICLQKRYSCLHRQHAGRPVISNAQAYFGMSLIARLHRQPFGLTRRMLMRAASSCHGEGEILVKGPRDHVISTGVLAGHCSGSCTITRGGTTVLAAVVKNERGVHNNSYLSVKYIERDRAAALIPSNYFRRSNGAPSTREIVIGRLIDRR